MTTAIKIRKGDTLVDGRAYDLDACVVKSLGDGSNRFQVLASLGTEDRDQDTIASPGWVLTYFEQHPVLVDSHSYEGVLNQIGEWHDLDANNDTLRGVAEYYAGQGNATADWAAFLASKGRAAFSVGFIPMESQPRKNGGRHYTKQELLEISHVIVPSNRQALQLMAKGVGVARDSVQSRLARELLSDFAVEQNRPKSWKGATMPQQKWNSQFMDNDDDADPWSPRSVHCLVAGCDDAAQTSAAICSEHLKYLMNADPEPPGSPPDDDDGIISMSVVRSLRRVAKAGKVISSANMGKLHSAMQSLSDVHSAACTQDDCPLEDGGSSEGPPTGKAAGEGSGSGGGFIAGGVRPDPETGKHGPVKGDTTHTHPVPDGEGGTKNAAHDHADGTSSHGDAGKKAAPEPETGKSFDAASFSASLEDAMTKALEAAAW